MKLLFKVTAVSLLLIFVFTNCSKPAKTKDTYKITLTDDLSNKINFTKKPLRIVSLAPSITEMIYFLDLGDKLVGNTLYCDYPEAAKKVTKVGDLLSIDAEKILMLKPDVVFVSVEGNTKENYQKLIKLGLTVFVSNPRNYEGIKKTLSDLGKMFNKKEKVDSVTANWDKRVEKLHRLSANITPQNVMFIIELKPLIVAGKNTFLNEYINICGMKNIVDDSKLNYPILNREEVLKRNPAFILYATDKKDIKKLLLEMYPEWKNIDAVKKDNLFIIDANIFFRPGPRFINAAEQVFKYLHRE
ncbi:MAG: cobalamin-binding protein [bacterium]